MCIQETHVTDAAEAISWFSSSCFLTVTAPGTAHSRGQVLLYRPSFSFVNSWVELEGRFLMAEFSRRGSFFRISSVYAPNRTPSATNSLPHVWTLLIHLFPRYYVVTSMLFLTEPKIVGALILLSSSVRALSRSLELLFREFCVLDGWRHLHPDLRAYTWLKPDGSLSSRIDLIGFSSTCLHLVSSCSIVSCPFSHHDAVFPGFSIPELFPRGLGRW